MTGSTPRVRPDAEDEAEPKILVKADGVRPALFDQLRIARAPALVVEGLQRPVSRDTDGQTRFDVEYAIYRGIGVSPERAVVKGTEIDVAELPEGDYVLRIEIPDLLDGRTCAGTAAFRRSPQLASR